jgi:hypothetical protein
VAKGGEVKEVIANFFLNCFPAVFTQIAIQVGIHVFTAIFQGNTRRDFLFIGMDRNTSAAGHGFADSPVYPGYRFLVLGKRIKNAAMPEEQLRNLILKKTDDFLIPDNHIFQHLFSKVANLLYLFFFNVVNFQVSNLQGSRKDPYFENLLNLSKTILWVVLWLVLA